MQKRLWDGIGPEGRSFGEVVLLTGASQEDTIVLGVLGRIFHLVHNIESVESEIN